MRWGSGGEAPGWGSGGLGPQKEPMPTEMVSEFREHAQLVGEEGVEPSRPYGHTDLNRARLPFRHSPWQR
jgi:hypothetical protein